MPRNTWTPETAAKQREYRARDPERWKAYQRDWQQANKEKVRLQSRIWAENNRERCREHSRKKSARLRSRVLDVLGRACVHCGFSDERALCVDHVNGGGCREYSKISTWGVYRKVIETAGEGYQVLCANCNFIKRLENEEHGSK